MYNSKAQYIQISHIFKESFWKALFFRSMLPPVDKQLEWTWTVDIRPIIQFHT